MTLTELESGLTKLVGREVLPADTIDDAVRIFESYNWNEAGDQGCVGPCWLVLVWSEDGEGAVKSVVVFPESWLFSPNVSSCLGLFG